MSHDILERRYRLLLRSYPAGYRRERTDELLDVLLSDAPAARRWPQWREAVALVRGGLRVRAGSTAPRPSAVLFWQGLQLAAVAVLALGVLIALDDLVEAFQYGGLSQPFHVLRELGPNLILMAATLAALLGGRQRMAAGLVAAAIVVPTAASTYLFSNGLPQWWAPVVAAPLVIAGLRRPADVPRLEPGNAVVSTLGVLTLHLVPLGTFQLVNPAARALTAVVALVVAAAFLWFATADQRLLLAAAPTFVPATAHLLAGGSTSVDDLLRAEALPSLAAGVAMVAGVVLASRRRRART